MFQHYASKETLLELYDRAVEEQGRRTGLAGALERGAALTERLGVLVKMRRGYQDQQAAGLMTLSELRERLAGLDEEKEQITATLAEIEEATTTCRLEAARDSLASASWYNPVHAEWVEDPDTTHPGEWLPLAARPEEVRRAYNRFGARFTVDVEVELTLSLSLDLEEVEKSLQKSIFWAAATP